MPERQHPLHPPEGAVGRHDVGHGPAGAAAEAHPDQRGRHEREVGHDAPEATAAVVRAQVLERRREGGERGAGQDPAHERAGDVADPPDDRQHDERQADEDDVRRVAHADRGGGEQDAAEARDGRREHEHGQLQLDQVLARGWPPPPGCPSWP